MTLGDRISQKLFSTVHGRNLIYNTCWEDPRVDHQALNLRQDDTVLVITSAGCNTLDYALAGPKHLYAVDLNRRQNALLELKIAGIRSLDFDRFFALFGEGRWEEFPSAYRRRLRPQLSPSAREFWDRRTSFFTGADRPSFYFHGTSGFFAWLINLYLDRIARGRSAIEAMLNADSLDDQARIYHQQIAGVLWHRPLRWTLRRDSTMSLLGVPRPQKRQLDREYSGGAAQFVRDRIDHVFGRISLSDNYFWRVYLTGRYTRECCPRYLQRQHFDALQAGLVDRISVHTCSVSKFLEDHDVEISRFVLLDHQDWLSHFAGGRELSREWSAIFRRAADGCRAIWRSAGLGSEFVDRVEVATDGRRFRVGERLRYRRELASELHARDRVHTYGSFHIADLTK